jgi:glycosyltransferase involved in cell wall biosynthesis
LAEAHLAGSSHPTRHLATPGPTAAGPSAARNVGLTAAAGRLVAFLDADDVWAPTFLARRVAAFAEDPALGLVWGPSRYWYPDDPAANHDQPNGLPGDRPTAFAPTEPIARWIADLRGTPNPSASVFRRDAIVTVGGYPEGLRRGEDVAACILVAAGHRTRHDPEVLVDYRRHAASATSRSTAIGRQADDDLAFGRWVVEEVGRRPELARLRRSAARTLHGLAHRSVLDAGPATARWRIARTVLGQRGARHRWWAVGLDAALPLRRSRQVAARLERAVGHDLQ